MNNAVKLALVILSSVGTAAAGSFEFHTLPPAALEHASALPAANRHLQVTNIPVFAAAHSFESEGYIGTMHLDDTTFVNLSTGPPTAAVPEPASLVLLGSGLAMAAIRRRRRAFPKQAFTPSA
jgi:hypothetical protein